MSKITAGISAACLYPEYPEVSIERLCKAGVKNLEIFPNCPSEATTEYVKGIAKIFKSYDANCISWHSFVSSSDTYALYTGYERRILDYLELHKGFFEKMNILGAKYFILHGNKMPLPDDVVFEGYSRLREVGKSFGIEVLQENVARCTTGSLDQLVRMKKALGEDVGFVLDTKQAVRKDNQNPYDFVSALGNSIKHVHFSDHGKLGECLLPEDGEMGTKQFITALKSVGFEGCVMLELYRRNYKDFDDLMRGYKILCDAIDTVNKED
ncbi:MAG: sugar phosphate isomerase/epimerase [Oscillospiraceae bacterium]|nr:sugar phosphate isomerase/epimerase [Oscillospiraceae bacterium]